MAKILVADDSPILLNAIALSLHEAGHIVTITNSGADAVCLLSHGEVPHLFILDLNMPGLDGREILKILGPTAPPIIIISGENITPSELDQTKVSRFLSKPFNQKQLLEAINSALNLAKE